MSKISVAEIMAQNDDTLPISLEPLKRRFMYVQSAAVEVCRRVEHCFLAESESSASPSRKRISLRVPGDKVVAVELLKYEAANAP